MDWNARGTYFTFDDMLHRIRVKFDADKDIYILRSPAHTLEGEDYSRLEEVYAQDGQSVVYDETFYLYKYEWSHEDGPAVFTEYAPPS